MLPSHGLSHAFTAYLSLMHSYILRPYNLAVAFFKLLSRGCLAIIPDYFIAHANYTASHHQRVQMVLPTPLSRQCRLTSFLATTIIRVTITVPWIYHAIAVHVFRPRPAQVTRLTKCSVSAWRLRRKLWYVAIRFGYPDCLDSCLLMKSPWIA